MLNFERYLNRWQIGSFFVGTLLMDIDENWSGGRRYIAREGMNKLLNHELAELSEQGFELVDELLELETQNAIYTT